MSYFHEDEAVGELLADAALESVSACGDKDDQQCISDAAGGYTVEQVEAARKHAERSGLPTAWHAIQTNEEGHPILAVVGLELAVRTAAFELRHQADNCDQHDRERGLEAQADPLRKAADELDAVLRRYLEAEDRT